MAAPRPPGLTVDHVRFDPRSCSAIVPLSEGEAHVSEDGPIHLVKDTETGDRFLVYESGKGARLDIRFEGDTLWMTQEQISRLFGRDVSVSPGTSRTFWQTANSMRQAICRKCKLPIRPSRSDSIASIW